MYDAMILPIAPTILGVIIYIPAMYQMHFFCAVDTVSLMAAGLPSRPRLRGTLRGGGVCTRRKFGARPSSVARALGGQSRATWQVITRLLSAEPEPCGTTETLHFSIVAPLLYSHGTTLDSSFPRCYSRRNHLSIFNTT